MLRNDESSEFTKNSNALYLENFDLSKFSVYGNKLGDNYKRIDNSKIKGTPLSSLPKQINKSFYQDRDGKVFYELNGETIEYFLSDRIKSVFESNGWLQMNKGYLIRIENERIVEFMLVEILPSKISNMKQNMISKKFGIPSEIKLIRGDHDYYSATTDFLYPERKLRISYCELSKKILRISLSIPLNITRN